MMQIIFLKSLIKIKRPKINQFLIVLKEKRIILKLDIRKKKHMAICYWKSLHDVKF